MTRWPADTDLTERGREQARGLAGRLSGRPLAAVYCSTLRRTIETATIAAAPHGLAPLPREALREIDEDVRILFSSGHTERLVRSDMQGAPPIAGFIQKPYNMQALSQKINEILS